MLSELLREFPLTHNFRAIGHMLGYSKSVDSCVLGVLPLLPCQG